MNNTYPLPPHIKRIDVFVGKYLWIIGALLIQFCIIGIIPTFLATLMLLVVPVGLVAAGLLRQFYMYIFKLRLNNAVSASTSWLAFAQLISVFILPIVGSLVNPYGLFGYFSSYKATINSYSQTMPSSGSSALLTTFLFCVTFSLTAFLAIALRHRTKISTGNQ